ncbi:glycoside hydrolase family 3 C-terminal domain-containing protein [Microbacterium sp. W1N]|uniref:glycoside hydrolase family 3 C-terminal domain-containing protein n=1 Tax=Microbacterium festucae TaxID=2977531 RepID=UPI0021C1F246|nr:glycoside hydrolase family 3 C-terminal domain-containing protein [Microbacterium festucae]MCT9821227.1 glycoside hydrolase family 3 C-terminal domain-containing protein [Microbacterium festucae]
MRADPTARGVVLADIDVEDLHQERPIVKDTTELVASLSLLEKAALLSGANTWQTRAIERAGIPAVWLADGPHGVRKQVGSADHLGINGSEPATCFPTAATVAGSWDDELAEEIGTALGREASAQGVGVLLGPGLNIKRSPLGGRSFEYFSEDPELSGRLAAAYVRGIQSQGVAATPKHFAVNSQELRRMVSDSVVDERTLREIYLTAFEIVVREAAPWGIMSSYNLVNGTYAHENAHLLVDILRREWGFDGAVVSDWGGSNDAVAAVAAGGTLEMPSPGFDSVRAIVAAVDSGALDVADLDARVAEFIDLVRRVTAAAPATVDLDAHHALARRAAAESAVLLRNDDDLLPLAADTSVALIGAFATAPRYQGAGSSLVNATRVPTLVEALGASTVQVRGVAEGFRRDGRADEGLLGEAVALAGRADVAVLALGLPEIAESEGLDRASLALPAEQVRLLREVHRVNPRTVVVLSAGGAVETPWISDAAAVLHAYLGGQAGAEAIADVLTGVVNPGGRLAETMPVSLADTPAAERFPSLARTAEYREGPFIGYRHYETAEAPVAFPFGFGLSYTTFAYRDLEVDGDGAAVTVTNTGARAGSEVVQLYIGRTDASGVVRPARELKGYAKVLLEPGESQRVRLPFSARTFRFFDVPSDSWRVEAGAYEVAVGSHVRDLPLRAAVTRDGVDLPALADDLASARAVSGGLDDTEFAALLGRPVPDSTWAAGPLGENDPMDRLSAARSPLARGAYRILDSRRRKAEAAGAPDLNILFLLNGPFRVISKMSGGLATSRLTAAVLTLVNGQTFRGLGRVVSAYFGGRRDEKATKKAFDAAATNRSA